MGEEDKKNQENKINANIEEGEPAAQKFIRDVVFYLVLILFIGFAATFIASTAILVDSWRSDKASYEQLMSEVAKQNVIVSWEADKIDDLEKVINELTESINQQQLASSTPKKP